MQILVAPEFIRMVIRLLCWKHQTMFCWKLPGRGIEAESMLGNELQYLLRYASNITPYTIIVVVVY